MGNIRMYNAHQANKNKRESIMQKKINDHSSSETEIYAKVANSSSEVNYIFMNQDESEKDGTYYDDFIVGRIGPNTIRGLGGNDVYVEPLDDFSSDVHIDDNSDGVVLDFGGADTHIMNRGEDHVHEFGSGDDYIDLGSVEFSNVSTGRLGQVKDGDADTVHFYGSEAVKNELISSGTKTIYNFSPRSMESYGKDIHNDTLFLHGFEGYVATVRPTGSGGTQIYLYNENSSPLIIVLENVLPVAEDSNQQTLGTLAFTEAMGFTFNAEDDSYSATITGRTFAIPPVDEGVEHSTSILNEVAQSTEMTNDSLVVSPASVSAKLSTDISRM